MSEPIINQRCDHVGCEYEKTIRSNSHDRCIVGECMIHDDVRRRLLGDAGLEAIWNVRKLTELQLGGSAAAMGVLREAYYPIGF